MLKDIKPVVNIPNPSHKKGSIINKLIVFLEDTLLIFQKDNNGKVDASEEELNQKLSLILEVYSRKKEMVFIFHHETNQKQKKGHNRKVDIGIFNLHGDLNNPIYTIEAKRLTTTFSKNREKEYVLGSIPEKITGGIERFKHNLHGANLERSALVAYVQRKDNKHWFVKINNWINEQISLKTKTLIWNTSDLLVNTCKFKDDRLAKSFSISRKVDKSDITLNHYFVNLNI